MLRGIEKPEPVVVPMNQAQKDPNGQNEGNLIKPPASQWTDRVIPQMTDTMISTPNNQFIGTPIAATGIETCISLRFVFS